MQGRELGIDSMVADVLMCPLGGLSHQILRGGLPSLKARQGCVDCSFPGVVSSRCLGNLAVQPILIFNLESFCLTQPCECWDCKLCATTMAGLMSFIINCYDLYKYILIAKE